MKCEENDSIAIATHNRADCNSLADPREHVKKGSRASCPHGDMVLIREV